MDLIYTNVLLAKEQGYAAIDITNNDIVFTDIDDRYKDYGFIIIDGITVYDKYGNKINKYKLSQLPNVTDSFNFGRVSGFLSITVKKNTKFYPLQYALTRKLHYIIINYTNVYIPAWVFKGIVAPKITLENPILDDDVLEAIKCYDVSIKLNSYCPSFEPLECTIFKLKYISNEESIPIMPKNAINITLDVTVNNPTNITLSNSIVQKLKVRIYSKLKSMIYLDDLPSLVSLDTSPLVSINNKTLHQLEELEMADYIISLIKKDKVYIMTKYNNGDELYSENLDNMRTFKGDFYNDDQYLLMPGLKKLTTYDKILKPEYIPIGLEEYYYRFPDDIEDRIDEIRKLEKYLLEMKSIKRMPLLLLPDIEMDLSFDTRYDIYYDIYIYSVREDRVYPLATAPYLVTNRIAQLQRVREHNERYVKRNNTLALMSKR